MEPIFNVEPGAVVHPVPTTTVTMLGVCKRQVLPEQETESNGNGICNVQYVHCTERVCLSVEKVLQIMFWKVPTADWLICSYLLRRQALATHVEKHNKTLRLIGNPAL